MKQIGAVVIIILIAITIFLFQQNYPENLPLTRNQPSETPTVTQTSTETPPQELTDAKASFAIFTNGTVRIFTSPSYHNLSPDVYIESPNPNIVNIKKSGTTWDAFFKTLPMTLTHDCLTTGTGQTFCNNPTQTLKFYLNGKLHTNALDQPIINGDQLLVSYGSETDTEIQKQLQQVPGIE